MVAHPVTDTLPRTSPKRTPKDITPLVGHAARLGANVVQGGIWAGIVADEDILAAVAIRRQLDERGDALLAQLIGGLQRAAGQAKRERHYDLHSLLVDLAASAIRIGELDDAEDTHDALIESAALGSRTSLRSANRGIGRLLGQAEVVADTVCELLVGLPEAEMPEVMPLTHPDVLDGLTLPFPLDGSTKAARELAAHIGGCTPCSAESGPGCEVGERLLAGVHRLGSAHREDRQGWP